MTDEFASALRRVTVLVETNDPALREMDPNFIGLPGDRKGLQLPALNKSAGRTVCRYVEKGKKTNGWGQPDRFLVVRSPHDGKDVAWLMIGGPSYYGGLRAADKAEFLEGLAAWKSWHESNTATTNLATMSGTPAPRLAGRKPSTIIAERNAIIRRLRKQCQTGHKWAVLSDIVNTDPAFVALNIPPTNNETCRRVFTGRRLAKPEKGGAKSSKLRRVKIDSKRI